MLSWCTMEKGKKVMRGNRIRAFWMKHKLTARVKVLVILSLIVLFVTPLRNALVPGWPRLFHQLSTLKVIYIHLTDLVYYVDRTPYAGSCDFVHKRLAQVKMPKLEEMPAYELQDWYDLSAKVRPILSEEHLAMIDNYKPSLTVKEQREMLYVILTTTQAFNAFNITYMMAEGSLIGTWRHHGIIPWDDDGDILFDREQWPLAKQVLSCLPDIELSMGSDYMWKVFHRKSDLWRGDSFIRFPFVDLFMYRHDEHHLWPVCIWMKTEVLLPTPWSLPVAKGVYEGYPVSVPANSVKVLTFQFGHVSSDCYSRTFKRREREMIPFALRTHLPCSFLKDVYPFVSRDQFNQKTGKVIEERKIGSRILSTFNTTYQGSLE